MFFATGDDFKQIFKDFFCKSHKKVGAHVGERRSLEILRSAPGAPLLKNLRSASRSAAPKYDENRGRSARSEILPKFNSLVKAP